MQNPTWTSSRYFDPPTLDPDPVDLGFGPIDQAQRPTDYFPQGVDDDTLPTTKELAHLLVGRIPTPILKDWLLHGANQYRMYPVPSQDSDQWPVHVIGVWNRLVLMHNILLEPDLQRDTIWSDLFEEYERHAMILRGTWEGSRQQRVFQFREEERVKNDLLLKDKPIIETPNYLAYKAAVQEAVAKGLPPPPMPPVSHFNDEVEPTRNKGGLTPAQVARRTQLQKERRERLKGGQQ